MIYRHEWINLTRTGYIASLKLHSDKTSLAGKKSKWTKAKNEVVASQEKLRASKAKFEAKKAVPDDTEEKLAQVEQQQAEAAQERMENATAMSVASPPRNLPFLTLGIYQRSSQEMGRTCTFKNAGSASNGGCGTSCGGMWNAGSGFDRGERSCQRTRPTLQDHWGERKAVQEHGPRLFSRERVRRGSNESVP
jgi:hypothetical protein